ncbi:hypothetical protein CL653_02400 [bacterium]|nr:hypothetical protein [bacterium]
MIKDIKVGDITSPENPAHIIIGMNSQLNDVTGIGRPFANKIRTAHPIKLGSVLSFKFDATRNLHMLICHHLGKNGWAGSDMHVRYGMDYLWQTEKHTEVFSIVAIGTGRIGVRDDADAVAIRTAMANSYLPADLFIYQKPEMAVMHDEAPVPLHVYRHFHPIYGEERIAA